MLRPNRICFSWRHGRCDRQGTSEPCCGLPRSVGLIRDLRQKFGLNTRGAVKQSDRIHWATDEKFGSSWLGRHGCQLLRAHCSGTPDRRATPSKRPRPPSAPPAIESNRAAGWWAFLDKGRRTINQLRIKQEKYDESPLCYSGTIRGGDRLVGGAGGGRDWNRRESSGLSGPRRNGGRDARTFGSFSAGQAGGCPDPRRLVPGLQGNPSDDR